MGQLWQRQLSSMPPVRVATQRMIRYWKGEKQLPDKGCTVCRRWRKQGGYLHTDILWWLSLLGSIFTPLDFNSVIFFTVVNRKAERQWELDAYTHNIDAIGGNYTEIMMIVLIIDCILILFISWTGSGKHIFLVCSNDKHVPRFHG